MRHLKLSNNEHHWPRHAVKSVETRGRDLVIRLSDWTRQKDEPAFDVECYIGGVYDWHESKVFSVPSHGSRESAKAAAVAFAQKQLAALA